MYKATNAIIRKQQQCLFVIASSTKQSNDYVNIFLIS